MWEAGRSPGEAFSMASEVVAVEGDVGVVRVAVHYTAPGTRSTGTSGLCGSPADGRCASFEEWPFWPAGSGGGYDPGPSL